MLTTEDGKNYLEFEMVQIWSHKTGSLYGCTGTETSPHEKNYSFRLIHEMRSSRVGGLFVQCDLCHSLYPIDNGQIGHKQAPQ